MMMCSDGADMTMMTNDGNDNKAANVTEREDNDSDTIASAAQNNNQQTIRANK
jgi:hypothetical protein